MHITVNTGHTRLTDSGTGNTEHSINSANKQ